MTGDRKRKLLTGNTLLEMVVMLLGTFLVLWTVPVFIGVHAVKPATPAQASSVPVKFHEEHRPIQWCVNGVDEPEFQQYPWSEFRPILQRKYFDHFLANVRFRYTVGLWPISIKSRELGIGSGGNLYQRAHFTFKSELRKAFEGGVRLDFNNTKIEGLLVQANFAPYGVGLPMGQFLHPKEFNCVDCEAPVGIPIACRKRTYMHVVHPTVFAYHHEMKVPQPERDRRQGACYNNIIPMQCVITDFKDTNTNLTGMNTTWEWDKVKDYKVHQPPPGMTTTCMEDTECEDAFKHWFQADCCLEKENGKCNNTKTAGPGAGGVGGTTTGPKVKDACPNLSTAPTEEIMEDPFLQSKNWPTFECKPYEVTVCRPVGADKIPIYERYNKLQEDPVTGAPYNPKFDPFDTAKQCCLGVPSGATACPPPVPPGGPPPKPQGVVPCPKGLECVSKVVPPIDRTLDPWVDVFPREKEADKCVEILQDANFGATEKVHGNFVWYLPPCRGSTVRTRFLMLVVHSFHKGIYSIVESDDYYELKSGAVGNGNTGALNPHIPSPLFTGFPHFCEIPSSATYLYSTANQNEGFDFSRSYDACIQNATGPKYVNDQLCEGVPKFTQNKGIGKKKKKRAPATNKNLTSKVPKCDGNAGKKPLSCEHACPGLPSTTPEYLVTPSTSIIKRTVHGGINIVTNFCIMPICVFVARFYKETFNLQGFKGQKLWYWMHMVGAGGSTVLQYMGFFTGKLVDDSDAHLVYGNIYIYSLAFAYITSWMRHKNRWISMVVESIHSICGYSCFLLALICVTNAKQNAFPINSAVKYVVYVAITSLTGFYVGMTVHICTMDKKFGMKPRRWHFPSVEARFDDLPVPGRNVRKIFIIAVLFINLPLTLSTLFL